MSHYTEVVTEFTDVDCLVKALEVLKPRWKGIIEVHQTAQSLYGYTGDVRPQKAHVIIRKQYVGGSSNDIGFERQTDGSYKAIISDYDRNSLQYNDEWLGKLKQGYNAEKIVKIVKKRGKYFTKQKRGQSIFIEMMV
jgi:hypothetical protein